MIPDKRLILFGLGVGAAVALALYIAGRYALPKVGAAVNDGVNSIVQDVTGGAAAGGEDTLGGVFARFREWISGDDAAIRELLKGAPATPPKVAENISYLNL